MAVPKSLLPRPAATPELHANVRPTHEYTRSSWINTAEQHEFVHVPLSPDFQLPTNDQSARPQTASGVASDAGSDDSSRQEVMSRAKAAYQLMAQVDGLMMQNQDAAALNLLKKSKDKVAITRRLSSKFGKSKFQTGAKAIVQSLKQKPHVMNTSLPAKNSILQRAASSRGSPSRSSTSRSSTLSQRGNHSTLGSKSTASDASSGSFLSEHSRSTQAAERGNATSNHHPATATALTTKGGLAYPSSADSTPPPSPTLPTTTHTKGGLAFPSDTTPLPSPPGSPTPPTPEEDPIGRRSTRKKASVFEIDTSGPEPSAALNRPIRRSMDIVRTASTHDQANGAITPTPSVSATTSFNRDEPITRLSSHFDLPFNSESEDDITGFADTAADDEYVLPACLACVYVCVCAVCCRQKAVSLFTSRACA